MISKLSRRVVVIDENESFCNALSTVLEKRGYEVHAVADPTFCPIYFHQKCTCDVGHVCTNIFIIDINQPRMTGLEFINSLKKNGCTVENIAIMSASWKGSELKQIEKIGCKILNKPFKMDELKNWLNECEKQMEPNLKLTELPKGV